jgi:hypothetical protein
VDYSAGMVTVKRAQQEVQFRLGDATAVNNGAPQKRPASALDSNGIACVPARVLCEALGVSLRYVPGCYAGGNRPDGADERWSVLPHLVLSDGERTGVVLINLSPPAVVEQVLSDLAHTRQTDEGNPSTSYQLGRYGWDWILPVTRVYDGRLFYSDDPATWAEVGTGLADFLTTPPGFVSNAWSVYGRVHGKWRLLTGGQDDTISGKVVARHQIPPEALKAWGLQVTDH